MKYLLATLIINGSLFFATAAHADTGQMCYELYKPVCAAQQVECFAAPCYPVYHTYSNECFAQVANAKIIHDGACTTTETGPIKPSTPKPPVRLHPVPTATSSPSRYHATSTVSTSTPTAFATTSTTTVEHSGFLYGILHLILGLFGMK